MRELKQKYFEDIIANMPGHVYWKDKDGVFLGCNQQQAVDAGFGAPEDIIGKTDDDMPWAIQSEYLRKIDQAVMTSGRPMTLEEDFELPGNNKRIYLSQKLPLYNHANEISGVLGISFDITERKKLEEELVKAKVAAESASRAKTEFLENMRHDIRTPLTGIVGFAEIIKGEAENVRVKEYADNLLTSSEVLLGFLNEILEAVKVFGGDIPANKRKFSLFDVTNKVICLLVPKSIEKSLSLKMTYDESIPKYVVGDPVRIQRILLELVSNALSFTEKGRVDVTIEIAEEKEGCFVLRLVVTDTGIGIPKDKQDEVFLRFNKIASSYHGIYEGRGLGLAIVKQFVDDIHAEIYCDSEEGVGTSFVCLIPLSESLLSDDMGVFDVTPPMLNNGLPVKNCIDVYNHSSGNDNNKTKVLVVEDQALAAKVACHILKHLDCDVDLARTGGEGLSLQTKNKYDLIFMDVGLPDISGLDVTKQIRSQEWRQNRHVPIVALTAHIDMENKRTCINSGMDAVLSKPLSDGMAKDIINAFIPKRSLPSSASVGKYGELEDLPDIKGDVVSLDSSMNELNCTESVAKEMVVLFVDGFNEDLPKFIKAKKLGEWGDVRDLVHKHKGGSLYAGVPRFHRASSILYGYLSGGKEKLRDKLYEKMLREFSLIEQALEDI